MRCQGICPAPLNAVVVLLVLHLAAATAEPSPLDRPGALFAAAPSDAAAAAASDAVAAAASDAVAAAASDAVAAAASDAVAAAGPAPFVAALVDAADETPDDYTREHDALLGIKSNWQKMNADHCTGRWQGVTCDNSTNRVIRLELTGGGAIYGSIPVLLEVFSKLQHLDLSTNPSLSGTLPDTFPAALPDLTTLLIYGTNIRGTIPATWGSWKALRVLSLDLVPTGSTFGGLSGTVPASLGDLTTLTDLNLGRNRLSGSIGFIKNLAGLRTLDLGGNKLLNGALPGPDAWDGFKDLQHLDLSDNQLTGVIGGSWNLPRLSYINAASNRFSGRLPALDGQGAPALQTLMLSWNDFEGGLRDEWGSLPNLAALDVSNNPRLGGLVPAAFSGLENLYLLSATNCGITGIAPGLLLSRLTLLNLSKNKISAELPNLQSWALQTLDLSSNEFSGSLPDHYASLPLSYIWLGSNKISGTLPSSWAALSGLHRLELQNNRLSGSIPASWSKLGGNLGILRLDRNCLSGTIPCGLFNKASMPALYKLAVCFNPVSEGACGAAAGTLTGCVSGAGDAGGAMVCHKPVTEDVASWGTEVDWRSSTALTGICSSAVVTESYARATGASCFQQANGPRAPCKASAPAAHPWGFANRGPAAGVMRVTAQGSAVPPSSICNGDDDSAVAGLVSARCAAAVDSAGTRQVMVFNLTTPKGAEADKPIVRSYWTGCSPPKAAATAAAALLPRSLPRKRAAAAAPCNVWRAVPATALHRSAGPGHASFIWKVAMPGDGTGCSCDEIYWMIHAQASSLC